MTRATIVRCLSSLILVLLCSCVATLAVGCTWGDRGSAPMILNLYQTKAAVYKQYGVPDDVFVMADGSRLLVYNHDATRGTSYGADSGVFPVLHLSHLHTATDTNWVTVDREGRVTNSGRLLSSHLAHFRLWPFGE